MIKTHGYIAVTYFLDCSVNPSLTWNEKDKKGTLLVKNHTFLPKGHSTGHVLLGHICTNIWRHPHIHTLGIQWNMKLNKPLC